MVQTRTAKGTASSKTSGTTLTLSAVTCDVGSTLVVGVAWKDGGNSDKPTVKFGNKDMKFVTGSEEVTGDTVVRQYRKKIRKGGKARDISITWTNAKLARCMFATQITEASVKDVQAGRNDTAATTPATSTPAAAPDSNVANTIQVAAFAARGPNTDTAATAGAGHTIGQRVGTVGAPPASNITLQETYEALTAVGAVRSTITLTTARDTAQNVVAFKASQTYTVSRAYYQPYDGHPQHEVVVFVLEDEAGDEVFQTQIDRETFEDMTDQEVTDQLARDCQWFDSKERDSAPSPDFVPDGAFNTRVSSFVNDTVVV